MNNNFWKTAIYLDNIFKEENINYCFIKTYGGNKNYFDNNIDIVIELDKYYIFDNLLQDNFYITFKDKIKAIFYETNKLMCTSKEYEYISIHIHENIGWHDHCFFTKEEVLANTTELQLNGNFLNVLIDEFEKEVLFLHSYFEKFKLSSLDISYLGKDYIEEKLLSFNIENASESINQGFIDFGILRKVWSRYYLRMNKPTLKNIFFHILLLIKNYKFLEKRGGANL